MDRGLWIRTPHRRAPRPPHASRPYAPRISVVRPAPARHVHSARAFKRLIESPHDELGAFCTNPKSMSPSKPGMKDAAISCTRNNSPPALLRILDFNAVAGIHHHADGTYSPAKATSSSARDNGAGALNICNRPRINCSRASTNSGSEAHSGSTGKAQAHFLIAPAALSQPVVAFSHWGQMGGIGAHGTNLCAAQRGWWRSASRGSPDRRPPWRNHDARHAVPDPRHCRSTARREAARRGAPQAQAPSVCAHSRRV